VGVVSSSVQQFSNYSPMAAATATTLCSAALPSNRASVTINPSIIPQMIFTLQNGNAVVPALVAGAGYAPTLQLVSPVAVRANTVAVHSPVSICRPASFISLY